MLEPGNTSCDSHVLIVEDTPMVADLVKTRLRREGVRSTTCANGRQAIAYLERADVDLVMLDIMMPDTDGYDVLRFIRGGARTRELPVIIVSAKSTAEDIEKGLALGADEYVTKPFNGADLVRKAKDLLRKPHLLRAEN